MKADSRWKTLKDLVDEAKKSPDKLMVVSYGKFSVSHFVLGTFMKRAGIKLKEKLIEAQKKAYERIQKKLMRL